MYDDEVKDASIQMAEEAAIDEGMKAAALAAEKKKKEKKMPTTKTTTRKPRTPKAKITTGKKISSAKKPRLTPQEKIALLKDQLKWAKVEAQSMRALFKDVAKRVAKYEKAAARLSSI